MTIDVTCQACDNSFEVEVAELLDDPRLQCPSCDARAPMPLSEGLSNALDDLLGQVARLRPRFQLVMEIESDDLPAPYDRDRPRAAADEDEDEDDEDGLADVDDDPDSADKDVAGDPDED